jgi:hypothetical protein
MGVKMNNTLPATAILLLVGCSSTPQAEVASTDGQLDCTREQQLGSLFPRLVCRTQREAERDRRDAKAWDDQRVRPGDTPVQQDR